MSITPGVGSLLKLVVSAPGRLCLFGEHMDWCGYAVIPAAIEMRSFLKAETLDNDYVEVRSYPPFTEYDKFSLRDFNPSEGGDLRYVRGVIKASLLKGYPIKGLRLTFLKAKDVSKIINKLDYTDLPVKKGLSSSAAICVCVAGIVYLTTVGFPTNLRNSEFLTELANLAYIGERKILGINCGQMDQYAAAFGSLLYIDCSVEPAKVYSLRPKIKLPLVIGDTMQSKDTPRILAWLGERFKKREPLFMEGMRNIIRIVEEAKEELSRSTPRRERIGELMNENQYYLKNYLKVSSDCPISPNKLDKLIEAALNAGALGAKLSGSGGGGCMVALCEPGDEELVARAIERAGGKAYITRVADIGFRVEFLEE